MLGEGPRNFFIRDRDVRIIYFYLVFFGLSVVILLKDWLGEVRDVFYWV